MSHIRIDADCWVGNGLICISQELSDLKRDATKGDADAQNKVRFTLKQHHPIPS
jgi:hypothetical protein